MKEKKKKATNGSKTFLLPPVPDQRSLQAEVRPLVVLSGNYQITSEDHFVASTAVIKRIETAMDRVHEKYDPFCRGLDGLHKMAVALRQEFLGPLEGAKRFLFAERQSYRERQEAVRKREAEKAAEILQQQQRKELENEAKKMDKRGETETATLFRERARTVPLPQIAPLPAVPETEGSVLTDRWTFEIVNPDEVQREYCTPDPKLIRPVVNALGDKCNIKGIVVTQTTKEHFR